MKRLEPNKIRRSLSRSLATDNRRTIQIEGYRHSAVLVPIIDSGGECTLLFTKRTEEVETHKGQVSFPGGVVDNDDRDPIHTALREAFEEVGIPGDSVETLGLLDDLTTPMGFVITPVVGYIASLPHIVPSRVEVAEAFQVPLSFFADRANGRVEYRELSARRHEVWFYDTGEHVIWGATAKIIRLLMEKLDA